MTKPMVKPIDWQLMSQKPTRRGQAMAGVKGRNDIRAVPKTQITIGQCHFEG